jgi:AraC-like DNA-binding protein
LIDDNGFLFGFKYYELEKKMTYDSDYAECNQLFFLLEGKIELNSSEALGKTIHEGEFFFLPISAETSCRALTPCRVVIFYFNQLKNVCEQAYFRDLWPLRTSKDYQFRTAVMHLPLTQLIHDMLKHFDRMENIADYQLIKYEEMFYIFRHVYPREEMAEVFNPLVCRSHRFRQFVFANYLGLRNVDPLVALSKVKRKTFDRQFVDEFEDTAYQWMLRHKSGHILYALSETGDQMQKIMRRYGFAIAPHFTRFCKEYFGATPMEVRRRLRAEKIRRILGKS